jgi:hypothetical protein
MGFGNAAVLELQEGILAPVRADFNRGDPPSCYARHQIRSILKPRARSTSPPTSMALRPSRFSAVAPSRAPA